MKHIRTLDRCILRDDVVINLIIEIVEIVESQNTFHHA